VMALAMLVDGPSGSPLFNGTFYIVVTLVIVATSVWLIRGRHWRALVGPRVG
jgi:hypothetical protein